MTLWDHLPVLVVIVPLMAGPLCVLVERPRVAWGVALAAAWLSFAAAVALAVQVSDTGTISYELGGWAPPWGIEYRIDTLGSYVLLIVTAIAALVMVAAKESVAHEVPEPLIARFYAASCWPSPAWRASSPRAMPSTFSCSWRSLRWRPMR